MIMRSLVGFKPKKFDLVHQTVFLVRGVVWARDYGFAANEDLWSSSMEEPYANLRMREYRSDNEPEISGNFWSTEAQLRASACSNSPEIRPIRRPPSTT